MGLLSKLAHNAPQAQHSTADRRPAQARAQGDEVNQPRFGLLARSLRARTPSRLPDAPPKPARVEPVARSQEARQHQALTAPSPAASAPGASASVRPTPSETSGRRTATPDELALEVEGAFRNLPTDVELPSRMFSVLKEALGIRRGALLLYDPIRLVYAPWASCGHDPTTLHRLRIPLGANETFNALSDGKPVLIEGQAALAPFQSFFSTREFGLLSRLVLSPLVAEERPAGVLLLAEVEAPVAGDSDLLELLSQICRMAAPLVQQARGRVMQRTEARGTRAGMSSGQTLSSFLTSTGGSSVTAFASVSLEAYASGVIASHPYLDPFRLQQDLGYFLGVFLSDAGVSVAVKPGLYVVGLRNFPAVDLDLFAHQLFLFLKGLFGNGGSGEVRIVKSTPWPVEGMKVPDLLAFLSP